MTDYFHGFDASRSHFTNKARANAFADQLAPVLGINRRSLVVEGKKGEFHLLNAYVTRYFAPRDTTEDSFDREVALHKKLVKEAMG